MRKKNNYAEIKRFDTENTNLKKKLKSMKTQ